MTEKTVDLFTDADVERFAPQIREAFHVAGWHSLEGLLASLLATREALIQALEVDSIPNTDALRLLDRIHGAEDDA